MISKDLNHKWSARLKHRSFIIKGNQAQANQYFFNWKLITSNLRMFAGRFQWAFKIKSIGRSVFVGMCLQSLAQQANFNHPYFNYYGHGNYIVNHKGTTYTDKSEDYAFPNHTFTFKDGDILMMCYDSNEQKLRIQNPKKQGELVFKIKEIKKGDCFRPCLHVLDATTIVQIIF